MKSQQNRIQLVTRLGAQQHKQMHEGTKWYECPFETCGEYVHFLNSTDEVKFHNARKGHFYDKEVFGDFRSFVVTDETKIKAIRRAYFQSGKVQMSAQQEVAPPLAGMALN